MTVTSGALHTESLSPYIHSDGTLVFSPYAPNARVRLPCQSVQASCRKPPEKLINARTPGTAVIGAHDFGVRFYGMPAGYEFATLLELIITASQGTTAIAPQTREMLAQLQRDIHLQVFVTPT